MGTDYEIMEHKVTKNNSVTYTGIMAKSSNTTAFPTIYIDEMYDCNMEESDIDYLAMKVSHSLKNARIDDKACIENYFNFELASSRIYAKLINAEKNKNLLQDVPYRRWNNLAVVYYYLIHSKDEERATVLVKNSHMKSWETDEDSLFKIALGNMKKDIEPKIYEMSELVEKLSGVSFDFEDCPIYVICNENRLFGASLLLNNEFMKEVAEKTKESFYILPSSIHELIVVPESIADNVNDMVDMVTQINRTEVADEEVLADSVYYYDKDIEEIIWMA